MCVVRCRQMAVTSRRDVLPAARGGGRTARTATVCSMEKRAETAPRGREVVVMGTTAPRMDAMIGGGRPRHATKRGAGGTYDSRWNGVQAPADNLVNAVVISPTLRRTVTRMALDRSPRREASWTTLRRPMVVMFSAGKLARHTLHVAHLLPMNVLMMSPDNVSFPGITGVNSPVVTKGATGPIMSYTSGMMEHWPLVNPVLRIRIGAVPSAGKGPWTLVDMSMLVIVTPVNLMILMKVVQA